MVTLKIKPREIDKAESEQKNLWVGVGRETRSMYPRLASNW